MKLMSEGGRKGGCEKARGKDDKGKQEGANKTPGEMK